VVGVDPQGTRPADRLMIQIQREKMPAGMRAWAARGEGGALTVHLAADLDPACAQAAMRLVMHLARGDEWPTGPMPAVGGCAAAGAVLKRWQQAALHPLVALAGAAATGAAALLLALTVAVPGPVSLSSPGAPAPVPVVPPSSAPAVHHHRRRPGRPRSPGAAVTSSGQSAPARHVISPKPSRTPSPSASSSPAPSSTATMLPAVSPVTPGASSQPSTTPAPQGTQAPLCVPLILGRLCL